MTGNVWARGYLCERVCICMHECVGRAGERVYEVFQYSEAVRFLRGDSSSPQTAGKSEKYGAFQNKALKIIENPLNIGPERFLA